MKRTEQIINNNLKEAIKSITPDVFPKLLSSIEKGEDSMKMTKGNMTPEAAISGFKFRRFATALAACLVVLVSGYSAYTHYSPESVIGLDINPSIELSVNRSEKILKINALNEDAEIIIGDMNLKNVDLDIGINALIGSMVKHGYIDEIKNSILISVDSDNEEKGAVLRQRLSEEIDKILNTYAFKGAVMSQNVRTDYEVNQISKDYGISTGKACLIRQLAENDPTIQLKDVASLSINDLNLLMERRHERLRGVNFSGRASDKGYIGYEKAMAIALKDANVLEKDISKQEIELDFEHGLMVYEVEFYVGNVEYEYEIDAKSGNILKIEVEDKNTGSTITKVDNRNNGAGSTMNSSQSAQPDHQQHQQQHHLQHQQHNNDQGQYNGNSYMNHGQMGNEDNYIGGNKALAIALNHLELTESQVSKIDIELEGEDGKMVYEVELLYNNTKYEYEIDAETGKIIDIESKSE